VGLKAKRAGRLAALLPSGVFALCPYIAGNWPHDQTNTGVLGTSHVDATGPTPELMAVRQTPEIHQV
jgi:hypothetical protein